MEHCRWRDYAAKVSDYLFTFLTTFPQAERDIAAQIWSLDRFNS